MMCMDLLPTCQSAKRLKLSSESSEGLPKDISFRQIPFLLAAECGKLFNRSNKFVYEKGTDLIFHLPEVSTSFGCAYVCDYSYILHQLACDVLIVVFLDLLACSRPHSSRPRSSVSNFSPPARSQFLIWMCLCV